MRPRTDIISQIIEHRVDDYDDLKFALDRLQDPSDHIKQ